MGLSTVHPIIENILIYLLAIAIEFCFIFVYIKFEHFSSIVFIFFIFLVSEYEKKSVNSVHG